MHSLSNISGSRVWQSFFFLESHKKFSEKSNKIFRKFITFFQGNLKVFQNSYKFSTKPIKVFILYLTNFPKKKKKISKPNKVCKQNLQKTQQDLSTIFQNKVFMTFSKNQTRFSESFSIFFKSWGKSYKIFKHLSEKERLTMLHSFHKNPTSFLSNSQKTWQDHSKNSQHVFTNTNFGKNIKIFRRKFNKILNKF